MARPSCRPPAPDRLGPIAAGLVLILAVVAGCSEPAATPLHSIIIDPTLLPAAEQARQAFVESVLSGDLTYHATFDGFVDGTGSELAVRGSLDVAGKDYQVAAAYTSPKPPKASYAIRYVGGTTWVRIDGAKWKKDATFRANSPFAFITRERDVKLATTQTVVGESLHRITLEQSQLIALTQIRAANLTDVDYKRSSFELLIDDDGKPVSGTARIEGVGRVSNELQEIAIQLDVVFSKVGAAIVIKAP